MNSTLKQVLVVAGLLVGAVAVALVASMAPPEAVKAQGVVGGQIPGLTIYSGAPNIREVHGNFGDVATPFAVSNSGAGAATTASSTTTDKDHPFVVTQTTGTTATGRTSYGAGCSGGAQVVFGTGVGWHWFVGVMFDTLSDGTETYVWRSGFKDALGAAGVDGCYFQYDSTASANWQCVCANNSTRTTTTSTTAVVAGTYQDLRILVSGTTSALFFVEGTQVCNVTTNIPSGTARATSTCTEPVKSVGITPRTANIDYMLDAVDRL